MFKHCVINFLIRILSYPKVNIFLVNVNNARDLISFHAKIAVHTGIYNNAKHTVTTVHFLFKKDWIELRDKTKTIVTVCIIPREIYSPLCSFCHFSYTFSLAIPASVSANYFFAKHSGTTFQVVSWVSIGCLLAVYNIFVSLVCQSPQSSTPPYSSVLLR